jgi:hypothetical protein
LLTPQGSITVRPDMGLINALASSYSTRSFSTSTPFYALLSQLQSTKESPTWFLSV